MFESLDDIPDALLMLGSTEEEVVTTLNILDMIGPICNSKDVADVSIRLGWTNVLEWFYTKPVYARDIWDIELKSINPKTFRWILIKASIANNGIIPDNVGGGCSREFIETFENCSGYIPLEEMTNYKSIVKVSSLTIIVLCCLKENNTPVLSWLLDNYDKEMKERVRRELDAIIIPEHWVEHRVKTWFIVNKILPYDYLYNEVCGGEIKEETLVC